MGISKGIESTISLTTALVAVAVSAHKKWWMEARTPFDPDKTDVLGYEGMRFADEDPDDPQAIGMFMEMTWWKALQIFMFPQRTEEMNFEDSEDQETVRKTIDILDARKRQEELSFETNGFRLVDLSDTKDFVEPSQWELGDFHEFHEQVMEAKLRELFPHATRFETFAHHIRGRRFGAPPVVGTPHCDFSLDMEKNEMFLEKYGADHSNERALMYESIRGVEAYRKNRTAYKETHEDVLEAVVSVWKPIEMDTPVCDKPMTFMDASTYAAADERDYEFHFYMWPVMTDYIFNTLPAYRPEYQKWYYYPFMTKDEAMVFYQYSSKKDFFRVAHAAFKNPNCPPDTDPRHSFDYRVMVFAKDL